MPMVPNLESGSVQEEPLPGRPYPRLSDDASAADFGGGIARGLEEVGSAGAGEQATLKRQNDQLRVVDANTQLEAAKTQLLYGQDGKGGAFSLHGMNAMNMPQTLLPQYDQAAQKISAGLTPDQQRVFAQHIAIGKGELDTQLNRYEYEESKRLADTVYKSAAEQTVTNASLGYRDPDTLMKSRLDLKALVQMQGDREGWDQPTRDTMQAGLLDKMHQSVIDSMLADGNTSTAKQYLTDNRSEMDPKRYLQMQNIVDEKQKAQVVDTTASGIVSAYGLGTDTGERALAGLDKMGLDDKTKDAVIRQVESGREALLYQRAQANDKQLTAIHTALATGSPPADAQSQIDTLYQKGALSQSQHIAMLDGLTRANNRTDTEADQRAFATNAFNNETKLDPKDKNAKDAVNVLFGDMTKTSPVGTPGYTNAAVAIVMKTGVIPPDAVSLSRALLSGGTPQQQAQSAQMLDRLQKANPTAYQFAVEDKETKAVAYSINAMIGAGTDPTTAAGIQAENAKLDKTARESLDRQWTQTNNFKPGADHLALESKAIQDGLKGDANYGSSTPKPPAAMAAEFNDLAHEYFYHTGGNLQQAQALALNDLKGTWGISQVNGSPQLTKYAPEHMFPGLTPDIIRADIAKTLGYSSAAATPVKAQSFAGKGGSALTVSEAGSKDEGSISVSNAGSVNDIRLAESTDTATSGGKRWALEKKDEFGAWDVIRDKDGMPRSYTLPDAPKPKAPENTPADLDKLRGEQVERKEVIERAQMREDKAV